MNPSRVDAIVDFAYGVMIFVSIVLIVLVETSVGVAFGVGVIVSYAIHVAWKMARFDPEWMTEEVVEAVEERLTEEVGEVKGRVEEINGRVDRRPRTEEVEERIVELANSEEEPDQ